MRWTHDGVAYWLGETVTVQADKDIVGLDMPYGVLPLKENRKND